MCFTARERFDGSQFFDFRCWPSGTGGQRRSRLPAAVVVPSPTVWRAPARGCNRCEAAVPALGQTSSISIRPRRRRRASRRRRQSSRPRERRQPAANDETGDGDGADHAVLAVTPRPRCPRISATCLTEYLNASAMAGARVPEDLEQILPWNPKQRLLPRASHAQLVDDQRGTMERVNSGLASGSDSSARASAGWRICTGRHL